MEQALIIDGRFNGPPDSGNGGYVCGLVASYLDGTVEVTLRKPPPLDKKLTLVSTPEGGVQLLDGRIIIAAGRPAALNMDPPPPPSLAESKTAVKSYAGFDYHIFPTCFVCGPGRADNDGLQIYPGPTEHPGRTMVSSPWTPAAELGDETGQVQWKFVWAALDCPGAFAIMAAEPVPAVLGRLTACINRPVFVGQEYVVSGWAIGVEGRKHFAGTAVHSPDGQLHALALATWIAI